MKSFKSFYEDLTFKVEVEGLPAMWMSGNSPGQVKNHLRKLVKQPSMIKSVKRQTKFDVKKMSETTISSYFLKLRFAFVLEIC